MGETQKRIESTTVDRPSPISAYNEQDDDRIFALLCARANAKTDDDAHAIAWAEDEIASLRKECASVSEIANNLDAENYRLSSRSPSPDTGTPEGWVLVPKEVLDRFPELNMSNYDENDVYALNSWGIELVTATPPSPESQTGEKSDV